MGSGALRKRLPGGRTTTSDGFCPNARRMGIRESTSDQRQPCLRRSVLPPATRRSGTALPVVGPVALGPGGAFSHILTALGLPVPTVTRAVIHLGAGVDPHLPVPSASARHGRGGSFPLPTAAERRWRCGRR